MSVTPEQLDQASEGIAVLLVLLGADGTNPQHAMTPEAWEGLRAVVHAGAGVRARRIDGAPAGEEALAAAGSN